MNSGFLEMRCPSCCEQEIRNLGEIPPSNIFAGTTLDEVLPGGNLYYCTCCYLYFRFPIQSISFFKSHYQKADIGVWKFELQNRPDWQEARYLLQNDVKRGGRILELGCFDGTFLGLLGDKWELFGIEIHEEAALMCERKGIRIISNDFDDLQHMRGQFDAVLAFDVIEHVWDPGRLLSQAVRVTKPGGVIIISTGNTDAKSWKFLGSRYWYCVIPEHISFVNLQWYSRVLDSLNVELVKYRFYSHAGNHRPLARKLADLTKNLIYGFFPDFFGWLRERGFGGIDVDSFPELRNHPPEWQTAEDHFVVFLRKTA